MVTIVCESPNHYDDVRRLTIAAFTDSVFGHNGEADLIESIRNECADALSLVAIDDDRVVGHVLFSPASIVSATATIQGTGLAPLAVLPAHQRRGIGARLVEEGLRRIAETEAAFTIVAGDPEFYPRFGFLPAFEQNVTHGFSDMPQNVFFIRPNNGRIESGLAYYHAVFGPQHVVR